MDTGLLPLITAQFVAKDDSIVRVQIFNRNVAADFDGTGSSAWAYFSWYHADWRMPAEEPIVIEWSGDKKDTIIGSTCTVTLVSPYDRALQKMYTTDPHLWCCLVSRKAVGADDFRDVWFGWLDPEFYEEPFVANKDYDVTLTFSDFGVLKRLNVFSPFNQSYGLFTMNQMINCALAQIDATCGNYTYEQQPRYTQYTSTELTDGTMVIGGGLQVQIANFTDEDGEVMTWYDALEAILKPLALRIEQRAGRYYLYDINAVVSNSTPWITRSQLDGCITDNQIFVHIDYDMDYYSNPDPDKVVGFGYGNTVYLRKNPTGAVNGAHFLVVDIDDNYIYIRYSASTPVFSVQYADNVDWRSDDQTLSVDETFNRVKVTFSPYADNVLFDPEKEVLFETTVNWKPVKNGYGYDNTEEYESFQLSTYNPASTADETKGGLVVCGGTTMFKIKSLQSGNDCEGVVAFLADYNRDDASHPELNERVYGNSTDISDAYWTGFRKPRTIQDDIIENGMTGNPLYRTRRIMIPNAVGDTSLAWQKKMLKIQIPMLYDQRYNPWEQADDDHNKLWDGGAGIKRRANSIGLRLNIRLYKNPTGGSPIRYFQNIAWIDLSASGKNVTMQSKMTADCVLSKTGWTIPANTQLLPTLIMYCKFDGTEVPSEDSPCLGGMQDGGVPFNNKCKTDYYFRQNNDGLYVPFPSISSNDSNYQKKYWLEIEVTDGLYIYDKGRMQVGSIDSYAQLPNLYLKGPADNISHESYGDCRWWLVGFPTVSIVENTNQIYGDVECDDIEQSGVIDANAAEELSIDTVCGCCDLVVAKGAYINYGTGRPVTELSRAGRTAAVEQLLIGTMYSQYAGRHLKLSGTTRAVLPLEGLRLLTDSHYPDKRFLVTQETYNVIDGESELTMVEASADNYTSE